jgi:hypothetical protein
MPDDYDDYIEAARPENLLRSVRRALAEPPSDHHRDHGPLVSIREAAYKGHTIRIRTQYSIEVDGREIHGHLAVTDDGHIHYHAVPNYSFGSAIDLVKRLIDEYPEEFDAPTRRKRTRRRPEDSDGGHHGGHHH